METEIINQNRDNVIKRSEWARKANTRKYMFVSIFVGIPFLAYLAFTLYPNVMSIWYSFLYWDGIGKATFVGLDNYKRMIADPFFLRALYHNVILALLVPVITIGISVILADILVNMKFKESSFYKTVFFFPNILSTVVVSLLWCFIYDGYFGLLNAVLKLIGIDTNQFFWLGDERTALLAIVPAYVWSSVGFYVVIIMNAMASIPKSYYEYAFLEGAKSMTRLFKITLPLISGVLKVSTLFLFLGVFKNFEIIMVLTKGGPGDATNTLGLYMLDTAMGVTTGGGLHNYGYASAIGMFLFVVLVAAKFIIDKFFTKETVEY